MKPLLIPLLAGIALLLVATGCSSGVAVGTRHHHVAVGGSIGR
ncbi:MAG: hypothetical protein QOE70_5227 [Chthoniobacter sp.]|jgi:hypothetical protein|nr:hypothetical protein [Chthoniobacter sp.]